jgi:hypothetical protein
MENNTMQVKDLRGMLSAPMTIGYLLSEVHELIEAVLECSVDHIREEWNDVAFSVLCLVAQAYSAADEWRVLDGLGRSSCEKFLSRINVWVEICSHHGVNFDRESLAGGSNYRKRTKVSRVLGFHEVEDIDWVWVSTLVGGFEVEA